MAGRAVPGRRTRRAERRYSTGFSLDGGRTLQLGGTSTATGTNVQINLNGGTDPGSGTLTIANGASFNDQTTSSGLSIFTVNQGGTDTGATATVNNAGVFIKSGSAATSTISTLFNNSGTVNVQSGTLSLAGGGTDVGATYQGAGTVNFSGGTRTLDAASSITTNATFSGGQTTVNGGTGTGLLTVTGGTATFNGAVTAGALAQSGSGLLNGSGTLTVTGLSTLSGGRESGSGTTNAQGGAALSTGFSLDGGRTLQLGGTSTATGTNVQINLNGGTDPGSGTLTIANGASFNDQTTSSGLSIFTVNQGGTDTGATATVNNAGVFIKSGSAATSTISTLFNNSGTVNVQSGTLSLAGGGTDVGATYQGAGTVNFSGGTRTLDAASSITTNATFSGGQTTVNGGTGTGLLTVTGGTATFNGAVTAGALAQSGSGLLNGSGTLTVTGLSTLSGGRESGSGTTNAQGGAALSTGFSLDGGRTLQLGGTSTATGTNVQINLNGGTDPGSGTLTIANGASFNDQTTSSGLSIFTVNQGGTDTGATATVNNAGVFIKSGSAATSTISTLFNNSGTMNVQSGTLSLAGGGTDVGATYQGAGTVNFSGGTRTLDAASSITTNATFSGGQTTVNGGTGTGLLTVTGGTATFNGAVTAGALAQSGSGLLNGSGTLTVTGLSTLSGGRESGSGTTNAQGGAALSTGFSLDGGRTLQLGGTSTATGTNVQINLNGGTDPGSGTLTIANGASFNDQTTSSGLSIFTVNQGGTDTGATAAVNNAGVFIKSGSAATSTISTAFNNTGMVDVQAGTLELAGVLTNTGVLHADGGNIKVDTVISDIGNARIDGSMLEYVAASKEQVAFGAATGGTLKLDASLSFTGTVTGFRAQETLDLTDINFVNGSTTATYANGTLTVTNGTQTAHITLLGSYQGSTFTAVNDGSSHTKVTVLDPPVANKDSIATRENTATGGLAATLLANDTDVDGRALTINAVGNAVNGTIALNNGNPIFTPNAGFFGTASFTYTVNDGILTSNAATVTVKVDAPPAAADPRDVIVEAGASLYGSSKIALQLPAATDADADTLTYTITALPSYVTLYTDNTTPVTVGSALTDAQFRELVGVVPATGSFSGGSISYSISDGTTTISKSFAVTVVSGNTLTAGSNSTVLMGSPGADTITGGSGNDVIYGGGGADTLTGGPGADKFVILHPSDGAVTITDFTSGTDGLYVFAGGFGLAPGVTPTLVTGTPGTVTDPAKSFIFDLSAQKLYFDAAGGNGASAVLIATLQGVSSLQASDIHVFDDAPIADNDTITINQNTATSGLGATLKATDFDPNNDPLTINSVGNAVGGTIVLNGGDPIFTPTTGFTGTASFTYTVSDGSLNSNTAMVFVNVMPSQSSSGYTFPTQPTTGVHLFGLGLQDNAFNNLLAGFYDTTGPSPPYDPVNNPNGTYALTPNILPFDPFLLPSHAGNQAGQTTNITLPVRYNLALPNVGIGTSISTEGLVATSAQNGTHNVIDQILITPNPALGPNGPLTIGAPIQIEDAGTNTIYGLGQSFRTDSTVSGTPVLSTYDVSWEEYDGVNDVIKFQIFNADGTTASPVVTAAVNTNFNPLGGAAPGWLLRSGGGAYVFIDAVTSTVTNSTLNLTGPHAALLFQGYATSGTKNTVYSSTPLEPDLSHYLPGATNQITQPLSLVAGTGVNQTIQYLQASAANSNASITAWNETVTDGNGSHDQVELAAVYPAASYSARPSRSPTETSRTCA